MGVAPLHVVAHGVGQDHHAALALLQLLGSLHGHRHGTAGAATCGAGRGQTPPRGSVCAHAYVPGRALEGSWGATHRGCLWGGPTAQRPCVPLAPSSHRPGGRTTRSPRSFARSTCAVAGPAAQAGGLGGGGRKRLASRAVPSPVPRGPGSGQPPASPGRPQSTVSPRCEVSAGPESSGLAPRHPAPPTAPPGHVPWPGQARPGQAGGRCPAHTRAPTPTVPGAQSSRDTAGGRLGPPGPQLGRPFPSRSVGHTPSSTRRFNTESQAHRPS